MARLRSDFWVQAYLRQRMTQGCSAVLAHRGAPEAGAIFVVVDQLDGVVSLYGPADQDMASDGIRRFRKIMSGDAIAIRDRLARELGFDGDLWVVEVEDRQGQPVLDLAQD